MGSSGSKTSSLFLKLVSSDVADRGSLDKLKLIISSSHNESGDAHPELGDVDPAVMILSLTYSCNLSVEVSNQQGISDIVLKSSEANQRKNVSGELKVVDPFSRSFVVEQTIEGKVLDVLDVWNRIKKDSRITSIISSSFMTSSKRNFDGWGLRLLSSSSR